MRGMIGTMLLTTGQTGVLAIARNLLCVPESAVNTNMNYQMVGLLVANEC